MSIFERLWRGGRGLAGGGHGRRGGNKAGAGPGGFCVCPKCGYREPHDVALRCADKVCPKCGTQLVRE